MVFLSMKQISPLSINRTTKLLKSLGFLLLISSESICHAAAATSLHPITTPPANCQPCPKGKPNLFTKASHRLEQIWSDGKNELYLPAYAWHNRYWYTADRIKTYNENPWGGGLGKGYYDEDGDWHGLYAFAFLDSHKNVEPIVGYAFLKALHLQHDITLGGGYAILATARPDINHGIPFPGALPWVSATYQRVSLIATYIPGRQNIGNVLFFIVKVTL